MELDRRRFLTWCGLAAMGGLNVTLSGCGATGLTGKLLHAAAQGSATAPQRPAKFVSRNDLGATPRAAAAPGPQERLIALAQFSDIHITLDEFSLTGYPQLEALQELQGHPSHLAMVVSHHPFRVIKEGRDELLGLLHRYPQVIAMLCGHEHIHRVEAFAQPGDATRGFWQIQTSSLIEFPQQGRLLEVFDNRDGTGTIRTFVFNQQTGGDLGENARTSYEASKEEPFDGTGTPQDRDVELLFQMPAIS